MKVFGWDGAGGMYRMGGLVWFGQGGGVWDGTVSSSMG